MKKKTTIIVINPLFVKLIMHRTSNIKFSSLKTLIVLLIIIFFFKLLKPTILYFQNDIIIYRLQTIYHQKN